MYSNSDLWLINTIWDRSVGKLHKVLEPHCCLDCFIITLTFLSQRLVLVQFYGWWEAERQIKES